MNRNGTIAFRKEVGCCFISRTISVNRQRQRNQSPRMNLSLRKLTLAVALSLTVSSHGASIAAPTTAPMVGIAQEETLLVKESPKPRAAKLAASLRSRGISDAMTVMLVSAMPVIELRGGIPLGYYLGVGPLKTLWLAIVGNLAPMIPTMLLLRIGIIRSLASRFLERARKAADGVSNARSRAAALALFVGIPLPGTGAWTGCLVAFVLGMPMGVALGALSVGVVMAGVIVSALCVAGWIGAAVAGCVLLGAGSVSVWRAAMAKEEGEEDMIGGL